MNPKRKITSNNFVFAAEEPFEGEYRELPAEVSSPPSSADSRASSKKVSRLSKKILLDEKSPTSQPSVITKLNASVRPQLQSGDFVVSGFDLPLTEFGVQFDQIGKRSQRSLRLSIGSIDQAINSDPNLKFGLREASLTQEVSKSLDSSTSFYAQGGLMPLPTVPWKFIGSSIYGFPVYPRIYEEKLIPMRDIGAIGSFRFEKFSIYAGAVNGQGELLRNVDDNFTIIGSIRHETEHQWASLSAGSGTVGIFTQNQTRRYISFDFYRDDELLSLEANAAYRQFLGFSSGNHFIYSTGLMGKITRIWWLGLRGGYLGSFQGRESQINGLFSGRLDLWGFRWNAGLEGFWNSDKKFNSYRYIVSTQWEWEKIL